MDDASPAADHRIERQVLEAVARLADADAQPASLASLLEPLIALLWAHRAGDDEWTRRMSRAIGRACFGEHHLWHDLGLAGRHEVSALLTRHFPELAAGNTRGLRWKRYLFLRLGDQLGIADLRPPRCDGCDDFSFCFPSPLDDRA